MPITRAHVDSPSRPRSAPATPTNRIKFFCSHGDKILPRPADGHLKYVGGETRVISIFRDITFPELMKKLSSMFNGEMILKYQLMPEDLDVLVTVKSNEDIRHMIGECDRHERLGAPRLRAFLFPASPVVMVNSLGLLDRHSIEQRYINSINGIVVCPPPPPPVGNNTSCTTFSVSSACSSPPETTSSSITRNHSSPSLSNYGYSSQTNHLNPVATASPNMTRNHHQDPPQPHHVHHQPHLSPKPPLDRHPHKTSGPEHLGRMRATGEAEYYSHRTNKGGHMYSERGSPYGDYCRYDQTDSPPSPDAPSSSHSIWSGR